MKDSGIQALIPLALFLFTSLGILISPADISSGRTEHARNAKVLEPGPGDGEVAVHLLDDPLASAMDAARDAKKKEKEKEKETEKPNQKQESEDAKRKAQEKAERDRIDRALRSPLQELKKKRESESDANRGKGWSARVLAIPLQSGHSSEDTEKRLRTRYAVVSALRTQHFLPVDKDHVRWLSFGIPDDHRSDALMVVELFAADRGHAPSRRREQRGADDPALDADLVIVTWLPAHQIREAPLAAFQRSFQLVESGVRATLTEAKLVPAVIGPTSSDALAQIQRDARALGADDPPCPDIYSPWATAAPGSFVADGLGDKLKRVIGTDAALVDMLQKELELREALGDGQYVLLVYEWSTLYGRAFERGFRNSIGDRLDVVPYAGQVDPEPDPDAGAPPDRDPQDLLATRQEEALGPARVDYIRRLSRRIRESDRHYAAIGIFGTDTFDKILFLRALHDLQPEAVFFTTDLDARFFHPKWLPFTRNLIVASHYPLALRSPVQQGTMPFRDCYQASIYVGVLRALKADCLEEFCKPPQPRIYEISRSGAYDLGGVDSKPHITLPDPPSMARRHRGAGQWWIYAALVFVLVVVTVLTRTIFGTPGRPRREIVQRWTIGAAVFLLVLVFWQMANASAASDRGEPFEFFTGISSWPAIMLRIVVTGLGVGYLFHACNSFARLREDPVCPPLDSRGEDARSSRRLAQLWELTIQGWTAECTDMRELWKELQRREQWRPRTFRVVSGVLPLMLLALFTRVLPTGSFFGWPRTPVRGDWEHLSSGFTLWSALFVLAVISIYVVDATALEIRFIQLRKAAGWKWGGSAAADEAKRRGIDESSAAQVLWIKLVEERSKVVSRLLYDPFIILALLLLVHNDVFDAFRFPKALLVIIFVALGVAWIAAFLMRRAAFTTKRETLDQLEHRFQTLQGGGEETKPEAERLRVAIDQVKAMDAGAFGKIRSHPILGALVLPFGGLGMVELLRFLL